MTARLLKWRGWTAISFQQRIPCSTSSDVLDVDEDMLEKLSPGRERDPRDFIPRTDGKSRQHGSSADGKSRQHGSSAGYDKLPIVHISCTHNNTILTITDHTGKVLAWTSAGAQGFKNARRGTTFAAQTAATAAAKKSRDLGFQKFRVKLKGPGPGRQPSLKGLEAGGLVLASIQDVTPVPHNGCRPKKARRL